MLRKLTLLIVVVMLIGVAGFWFLTVPEVVVASTLEPHRTDLANGETLFNVGGCASCHASPNQKDRLKLGGGMALKTPFGTLYPPNISSDAHDGIGAWTDAQFITAITKGTSPSGQPLYPAFPYTSYQHMRTGDLLDLFAYLKTLPAVQGRVRDHALPFPFNIRRGVRFWQLLFLNGAPFKPTPTKSAQWNRGAYLVNGPGHCAECHSPRNVFGAIVPGKRFAGGPSPDGKGWVPNITQKGLADWSVKDIAYLLESGMTLDGDSVGSSMTDVVSNISKIGDADRLAMATYLKSLPPVEGPTRPKKK